MAGRAGAFLQRFQFDYLRDVLRDVSRRFPLSFLCCLAGTALAIFEAHDVKPLDDDQLSRALLFLSYGLVFFAAARLYAEGLKVSRAGEMTIAALGGVLLAAACFGAAHFSALHLFVGSALALSMLFAPYIGRKSSEDSLWFYNYTNGISLVVAGLSSLVLCLGACAVIGSMDYLLYDMKLSGKIYGDVWIFGFMFFGPVAFMHQLSRQFDFEKSECAVPKGVYFIANYLVVPLVLVYTWVLYVYFLKIAVQWELPKGNLAYMVTGFGSAGTAARLAVFPMRQDGTKLLQQFYKFFYALLIVPVFLLAFGLYTRLSQYGVTEDRYAIGLALAWLTGMTGFHLLKPKAAHIKHVPMALAALFLFTAAGPWGVDAVSEHSQVARLENMLKEAGVISPSGDIAKIDKDVPFALRKDISTEMDYFEGTKEQAIEPLVAPFRAAIAKKYKNAETGCKGFMSCWDSYARPQRIMEAWGMAYVSRWEQESNQGIDVHAEGWNSGMDGLVKVAPYAYLMSFNTNVNCCAAQKAQVPGGAEVAKLSVKTSMTPGGVLTFTLSDGRRLSFSLLPVVEVLYREKLTAVPETQRHRLVLTSSTAGIEAELRLTNLHAQLQGKQLTVQSAYGILLFTP